MSQTAEAGNSDVDIAAISSGSETRIAVASQWQLVWWRFRRHKIAMISGVVILLVYLTVPVTEFLAPFDPYKYNSTRVFAPPQPVHLFDEGRLAPHVCGYQVTFNEETYKREFVTNCDNKIFLRLLAKGQQYKLLGLFGSSVHLVGPEDPAESFYLLGSDRLGRDLLSRLVYGTRISMSIGLVGVTLSLLLGVTLGGISGYYGGAVDTLVQRMVEFLRSIPSIPLWMGLAAAIPLVWDPLVVYFCITVILSFLGWTGLARAVRGSCLAIKTEDYVLSARLVGASELRIIFRHMLPAMYSYIIARITLAVPGMILAETSLSFLGLGLRPPTISWGVLLKEAQEVQVLAQAPWLLVPAVAVIATVLAFNFLGDGIRDAADPYG